MDFTNRCILVTGASSGIGEATARKFAAQGANVGLVAYCTEELDAVVDSICVAGGNAVSFVADFAHSEQVRGLVAKFEQKVGPLDVLVNNAGIGLGASILETTPEELHRIMEVNFFAMADLCRQALGVMSKRGRGRIINVSSAAGMIGSPGVSAYSASKGAVHAFSQALRMESRAYGVHVSEVLPISVRTAFFKNAEGEKYEPGGIVLTADRVAQSIVNCAASPRPRPEILPYRPIRMAYIVDRVFPGLLDGIMGKKFRR